MKDDDDDFFDDYMAFMSTTGGSGSSGGGCGKYILIIVGILYLIGSCGNTKAADQAVLVWEDSYE